MRVLIAGCGYVGLEIGRDLVAAGHEVWGLRRAPETADTLRGAGLTPVICDVSQPAQLRQVAGEFDWLIQCAAAGGGEEAYRALYIEGTRNLLSRFAGTPPKRFVWISSTSVYGQTEGELVDEVSPTEPSTPTGRILVAAERLLLDAARGGFPAIILRASGIYGPSRDHLIRQFLSGATRLAGHGEHVLNMIHRDDLAGAVVAALERGEPGAIYNATDDAPVTELEFYAWLAGQLDRPLPPRASATEMAHMVGRKRGWSSKRVSNRRLREELNYKLVYPTFREGYQAIGQF